MYKNAGIEGFDFMDNAKDSMNKMKGRAKKKLNLKRMEDFFQKLQKEGLMSVEVF